MPVFHVYLNGKKLTTAGVGNLGVLAAHVTWVRRKGEHTLAKTPDSVEEELTLHVSPVEEHVRWLDRDLKIGDEVHIMIAEDSKVDRPRSRGPRDRAKELRSQKRMSGKWPSDLDGRYRHRGNTALTEQRADRGKI